MATIQKSSEKGYRIYWRFYLPDGSVREKYKTSKLKTRLQEILPDVMKIETLSRRGDLNAKDLITARNMRIISQEEFGLFTQSVPELETHYLEDLRPDFENKSKVESSGPYCHRDNLYRANRIERYFKDIPIAQISPERIETFRAERQRSVTPTTINHDLKILRKYLDIAVNRGWIRENPARKLKLMKEPRGQVPRCLYPEELKTLFDHLKSFAHLLYGDFEFIIRALIYTGMRRGELCSLTPDRVKLHLRQVHIMGKGKKTRIVGIHRSLMEEFKARVKLGRILVKNIHPSSISRAFKEAIRTLGLPEVLTLHSLRHTYISYLLEKGIPSKRVKERAGHFSLNITERYTHALPGKAIDEDILDFEV